MSGPYLFYFCTRHNKFLDRQHTCHEERDTYFQVIEEGEA